MRNVTAEITFLDSTKDNAPIPGLTANVVHRLSGATAWLAGVTSSKSDANGKATAIVAVDTPNKFDFQANFAGGNGYDAQSSNTVTQQVDSQVALKLAIVV
jgi:hypothetical protein